MAFHSSFGNDSNPCLFFRDPNPPFISFHFIRTLSHLHSLLPPPPKISIRYALSLTHPNPPSLQILFGLVLVGEGEWFGGLGPLFFFLPPSHLKLHQKQMRFKIRQMEIYRRLSPYVFLNSLPFSFEGRGEEEIQIGIRKIVSSFVLFLSVLLSLCLV